MRKQFEKKKKKKKDQKSKATKIGYLEDWMVQVLESIRDWDWATGSHKS